MPKRTNSKTLSLAEARAAIRIDKNSIDDELVRHPSLMSEVGESHTMACSERDKAKDAMEREEAKAYQKYKNKSVRDNLKETDHAIKQQVRDNKDVVKAVRLYRDNKAEAAHWEALWEAFKQRSFMLNKLADLYIAEYYTSDSASDKEYERPRIERQSVRRGSRSKRTAR